MTAVACRAAPCRRARLIQPNTSFDHHQLHQLLCMLEVSPVTNACALADPSAARVCERIVGSAEITVVDLTRGSGITQGAIRTSGRR